MFVHRLGIWGAHISNAKAPAKTQDTNTTFCRKIVLLGVNFCRVVAEKSKLACRWCPQSVRTRLVNRLDGQIFGTTSTHTRHLCDRDQHKGSLILRVFGCGITQKRMKLRKTVPDLFDRMKLNPLRTPIESRDIWADNPSFSLLDWIDIVNEVHDMEVSFIPTTCIFSARPFDALLPLSFPFSNNSRLIFWTLLEAKRQPVITNAEYQQYLFSSTKASMIPIDKDKSPPTPARSLKC